MKLNYSYTSLNNHFVKFQTEKQINDQRIAGKILANIMSDLICFVNNKDDLTLLDYDKYVEEKILQQNCSPTFKGYKGFPNSVCISVNKELVHGIPSNRKLSEGDIVSFDFGVTYESGITDSAVTLNYGEGSEHHKK